MLGFYDDFKVTELRASAPSAASKLRDAAAWWSLLLDEDKRRLRARSSSAVGKCLRGSALRKNGLAFLQESDEVRMTLVDW